MQPRGAQPRSRFPHILFPSLVSNHQTKSITNTNTSTMKTPHPYNPPSLTLPFDYATPNVPLQKLLGTIAAVPIVTTSLTLFVLSQTRPNAGFGIKARATWFTICKTLHPVPLSNLTNCNRPNNPHSSRSTPHPLFTCPLLRAALLPPRKPVA
jgi:hypothetical protein